MIDFLFGIIFTVAGILTGRYVLMLSLRNLFSLPPHKDFWSGIHLVQRRYSVLAPLGREIGDLIERRPDESEWGEVAILSRASVLETYRLLRMIQSGLERYQGSECYRILRPYVEPLITVFADGLALQEAQTTTPVAPPSFGAQSPPGSHLNGPSGRIPPPISYPDEPVKTIIVDTSDLHTSPQPCPVCGEKANVRILAEGDTNVVFWMCGTCNHNYRTP